MNALIVEILVWYEWLRAMHIIAFIAWMAGLLYLPRLFVYHAQVEPGSQASETFKIMERKLLRIIMHPSLIATWLFGIVMLIAKPDLLDNGWMHVKMLAVVLLTAAHVVFARWQKEFAQDRNIRSQKFYRFVNEIPTLLMIVIVIMAVVEPF